MTGIPDHLADGRYTLHEPLGQGGMATVLRAHDHLLQVDRAIKILSPQYRAHDKVRGRFLAEAQAMARLSHSNIVPVYDVGEAEGIPFIVMGLITGGTLVDLARGKEPMTWEKARPYFLDVLTALEVIHAAGMVHRDIKPANVLISADGRALLTDFGIAQMSRADLSLTRTGAVMGTLAFMAPEQKQDAKGVGPAADLYAVAATLYAVLTLEHPTDLYVTQKQQQAFQGFHPEVRRFFEQACAFDPQARFESAAAQRAALQAVSTNNETILVDGPVGQADRGGLGVSGQTNIVPRLDDFVGRQAELEELERLVCSERGRLVTLKGPGGVGKTRVAEELAQRCAHHFAGGCWFISVANAHTQVEFLAAVGRYLEVPITDRDPQAQIATILRDRGQMLLVLDNLEQVVDEAASLIGDWLRSVPELRILVTSREDLRIAGELVRNLEPLSEGDAVQLFALRAASNTAAFSDTSNEHAIMKTLVAHLDGLPLAVELAAAQMGVISLHEMVQRMEEQLLRDAPTSVSFDGLLGGHRRGHSTREFNLRGAIQWSWDLLEPWEQHALAQCSIFRGGMDLHALEAVIELGQWSSAHTVSRTIQSLIQKSMLQVGEPLEGVRRIDMLTAVRHFVRDRLMDTDLADLQSRHLRYFAHRAEANIRSRLAHQDYRKIRAADLNLDNFHVAFGHGLKLHEGALAAWCALEIARIVKRTGPLDSVVEVFDRLLAQLPEDDAMWLRVEVERSRWVRIADGLDMAVAHLEQLLPAVRQSDDVELEIESGLRWNYLLFESGENNAAMVGTEALLQRARDAGLDKTVAEALHQLGFVYRMNGLNLKSRESLEQAIQLTSHLGMRSLEGQSHSNMGTVEHALGHADQAIHQYNHAIRIAQDLCDRSALRVGYRNRAWIHQERGELALAEACFRSSMEIARDLGASHHVSECLGNLGNVYWQHGRLEQAIALYEQSLEGAQKTGSKRVIVLLRNNIAMTYMQMHDYTAAKQRFVALHEDLDPVPRTAVLMYAGMGIIAAIDKDFGTAHKWIERAKRSFGDAVEPEMQGTLWAMSAAVFYLDGSPEQGDALMERAEALMAEQGWSRVSKVGLHIDWTRGLVARLVR